jgi:hypothetical protein
MAGNLAPTPGFPERQGTYYERESATPTPEHRGPLRFQENSAPHCAPDFATGARQGYETGARSNQNANAYIKSAAETMHERMHPGSAAWTEAPTFVGEFAHGVSPVAERRYEGVVRDGWHQARAALAVIRGDA